MKPERFQRELEHLRDISREFGRRHPAIAPLLLTESADPDVERILEGTAFLAAMVAEKIDDQLPEIIHTLTQILFPHYLKPLPSVTAMRLAPRPGLMEPLVIPKGTRFASVPVGDISCVFSTTSDMSLLPLTLADCSWREDRETVLRLRFATQGVPMNSWDTNRIRLFLSGEYAPACERYRMLTGHVQQVVLTEHGSERSLRLPGNAICPAGFGDDEAILPYSRRSFAGFRLLQEFFVFPEKYLFLDVAGLAPFLSGASGKGFDMDIYVDRASFRDTVPFRREHVSLHVVPAINLFAHGAEPVHVDFTQPEYRIVPADNAGHAYEIHSIVGVTGLAQGGSAERSYRPFEIFANLDDTTPGYTQIFRSDAAGGRLDWYISFARPGEKNFEKAFRPETLSVDLLCTNGTVPESLKAGDVRLATANSPVLADFENITVPTPYYRPQVDGNALWHLVSHMYVNYFTLGDRRSLQALLGLYVRNTMRDQGGYRARLKRIESIEDLSMRNENRLVHGVMMRGSAISLRVDPAGFPCKGDMLLFGSVLDRFFASYSGINSYTRLCMEERDSRETLTWPPRLGSRSLL